MESTRHYELIIHTDEDIDTRIRLCVYIALSKVFVEKWTELADLRKAA
jgi:hypothetical protein